MTLTAKVEQLRAENEELRRRLQEAEDTLAAIRTGGVDAFVVSAENEDTILTLETADRPFRTWVEQMQQSALTLDSSGNILYCNRRFGDLLQKPHESLEGASLAGFLVEEDRERLDDLLNRGGAAEALGEARLRRGDGSAVAVLLTVGPLGMYGTSARSVLVTDLTEQKYYEELRRTQEALRVSRERLDLVVEATGLGLWYCDLPFDKLDWNATCKKHFGFPADAEVTIGDFFEHIHPDDRERTRLAIDFALSRRGPYDIVYRTLSPSGQQNWIRAIGRAFVNDQGTPIRFDGVTVDVTPQKQTEEALREADRRKDEFIAMLAHELRNPLAPIRNASHLLGFLGLPQPELKQAREVIERQVSHMTRLIDDLLDVSRIARGKVRLHLEQCDLRELVRATTEDYRGGLEGNRLALNVELPEGPVHVMGDPIRLSQVVGNLLHNANKFTDPGGVVCVGLTTEEGRAVLRVRDSGIGMEPEMLARVFETFAQADRSLDRSRGGLGLGLALVRGLIDLHNGEASASSAGLGKGSEFTIRLPLKENEVTPPSEPVRAENAGAAIRVLIIEDNRDSADSLKLLLDLMGHQVEVAYAGQVGVEAAKRFVPQLVLCDIGLPGGMDGYAVARALRGERQTDRATLIALTGYGQDEFVQRAHEAGFDRHMTKPVDLSELEKELGRLSARG